jgi:thioredoxin-related protein
MKLKRLFFITILMISSVGILSFTDGEKEENKIEWLSIDEALERSKTEPRVIFVDVYTTWCGWCKVMDRKTFANPSVIEYVNENYYAVKMNAENQDKFEFKGEQTTNAQLARTFRISGYPTVVLINDKFTKFTPRAGFRGPEDFIELLKQHKEKSVARR